MDQGWSAEIALPWAGLASPPLDVAGPRSLPPQAGEEWRLNIYRFERVRKNGTQSEEQASAWSPVGKVDFHVPERFGRVVFGNRLTAVEEQSWGLVKVAGEKPAAP